MSPSGLLEWRTCWEVHGTDYYVSVLLSVTEGIVFSYILISRDRILFIFMSAMNIVSIKFKYIYKEIKTTQSLNASIPLDFIYT